MYGAASIGCSTTIFLIPSDIPMQRSDRWSQWRLLEKGVLIGKDILYRSMGSLGGRRSFPQRSCIVIEVVREQMNECQKPEQAWVVAMVVEGTGQRVAAVEQQSRALHAGRIFAKSSLQDNSLPRAKRAYAEVFWRCWLK